MQDVHLLGISRERPPETQSAISITDAEALAWRSIPPSLRVARYMQARPRERCAKCNKFIGNHSLGAFVRCLSYSDLHLFDTPSIEARAAEVLAKETDE